MRAALIAVMVASTLAGCAGLQAADTRSAERALTAAGFEARPADSPEKLFYRAVATANGAEMIKSLGLAQAFDIGGCGGWI